MRIPFKFVSILCIIVMLIWVFRLVPAVPLGPWLFVFEIRHDVTKSIGIPHRSMQADTYAGWTIPAGSMIMANLWQAFTVSLNSFRR